MCSRHDGHPESRRIRRHPESLDRWENEGGSLGGARPVAGPATRPGLEAPDTANALFDALPLGILITGSDGRIRYANPAGADLLEVPGTRLLGAPLSLFIEQDDGPEPFPGSRVTADPGRCPTGILETRMVTGSGRRLWTRHFISNASCRGSPGGQMHVIEDITRFRDAERAREAALDDLSRERERARVTLECIGDAVISTNAMGEVTYLNKAAENLSGWARNQALGRPISEVFRATDPEDGELVRDPARQAMDSARIVHAPHDSLLLRRDGSELAVEASAAPIVDGGGRLSGSVVIFRDRRLSRENTERMNYLARHDALTGLPNRVAFAEHLEQAIRLARRHDKRVGVLFLDLDGFKAVNDGLGHTAGDRLLRELSRQLTAGVRATDLVCRYGGDEFVVVVGDISRPEDAGRVAAKIRAAAAAIRRGKGQRIPVGLSIGISLYPDDGNDIQTLVDRADAAMYHAKLEPEQGYRFYRHGMQRPVHRTRAGGVASAVPRRH